MSNTEQASNAEPTVKAFFLSVKKVTDVRMHDGSYTSEITVRGDLVREVRSWTKSAIDEERIPGEMCRLSLDIPKQLKKINQERAAKNKPPQAYVFYTIAESAESFSDRLADGINKNTVA